MFCVGQPFRFALVLHLLLVAGGCGRIAFEKLSLYDSDSMDMKHATVGDNVKSDTDDDTDSATDDTDTIIFSDSESDAIDDTTDTETGWTDTGETDGSDNDTTASDNGEDSALATDDSMNTDPETDSDAITDTETDSDIHTGTDSDSDIAPVCISEAPPYEHAETIDLVWKEMIGEYDGLASARPPSDSVMTQPNLIWEQLLRTGGELQYCIRWESGDTMSSSQRNNIEAALERWINTWFDTLIDYDCWPFTHISVTVSGVAVRNRAQATWPDSELPVYVGDLDDNAPQCPTECGRFFNQDGDFSQCAGGESARYDMSLWLTDNFTDNHGAEWGQRLDKNQIIYALGDTGYVWWQQSLGFGLGFAPLTNWSVWNPDVSAPISILNSRSTAALTQWDRYMLRYAWDRLKDNYSDITPDTY